MARFEVTQITAWNRASLTWCTMVDAIDKEHAIEKTNLLFQQYVQPQDDCKLITVRVTEVE